MRTKSIEAKDIRAGDCIYLKKELRDVPGMFTADKVLQNGPAGTVTIWIKGSGQHLTVLPYHTFWLRLPEGIHEEEDMWTYLDRYTRVNKPEKHTHPKKVGDQEYYGFQECQSFMEGRWEGFVTLIKTEAGFIKKMKEWEDFQ